jgi:opacity protein-like surface antigen
LKKIQVAFVLSFIIVILSSAGFASALSASDASATVYLSAETFRPNETIAFRITFTSNTDQQIIVQRIGIHFDWMGEDVFSGKDLTSSPQTIPGYGNYTSDPIISQIPFNVSVGSHTYYVGVDGLDVSGNFTWNGPNQTIQIAYSNTGSTTPNPTPTPGGNGNQDENPPNLVPYLLIVAVAAIVIAVFVIVKELRKKPKQTTTPVSEKTDHPTEQPQKDNYDI